MTMSLRGTVIGWKWLAREVVALLPVILLISSACTMLPVPFGQSPESPGESQGFRYRDPLFILELKNVEVFDNEIKMTFMYTNLARNEQIARPRDRKSVV